MTANEVYAIITQFINNEFKHHVAQQDDDFSILRKKTDRLFLTVIGGLLSVVAGLLFLILR